MLHPLRFCWQKTENEEEDESSRLGMKKRWSSQNTRDTWPSDAQELWLREGCDESVCEGESDGVGERSFILPQSLLLQIDCLQLGRSRETAIMHILQRHYVNRFEHLLFFCPSSVLVCVRSCLLMYKQIVDRTLGCIIL